MSFLARAILALMVFTDFLYVIGGAVIGLLGGMYLISSRKFDAAESENKIKTILSNAEVQARKTVESAKEKVTDIKKQSELEQNEFSGQLDRMEKMFQIKIAAQQKREEKNRQIDQTVKAEERNIEGVKAQVAELNKQIENKLLFMTGASKEQAKNWLLMNYDNMFRQDAEILVQRETEWAQERALRDSRNVLAGAIYRFADPTSVEHEHAHIIVPRDEIKGKIVGRGGRNIAFFEELFGVDVIFNDEPNTIIISCFNLVQREIAKAALERLIREKIISEEVIMKVKPLAEQDTSRVLKREGEKVLKILGLTNMPVEFAKLVGRLQFRTSYGQNALKHCFEVGYFARLIASEIGADEHISWIAGVFHDIGKAVDQEVGGSHDVLTKEILEKFGFSKEIVHAAWTHHNAAPIETVEARVVQAADAISAGRPGARAESLERYLAKIRDLQDTALSFEGVKKAYAINAGREVRVIVDDTKINDKGTHDLAAGIAAKVEEKGGYPGKIKVTTIRVTKTADYAKSRIK